MLCLAGLLTLACGRELVDRSEAWNALLARSEAIVGGSAEGTQLQPAIILGARLSGSGRFIVVLDAAAPFVKIYQRGGQLHAAFLLEGQGPGEAVRPVAIAVLGDSVILVADLDRRVSLYDFGGRPLAGPIRIGFTVLAATAVCGGDWLVYGPRYSDRGQSVAWLHRVHFVARDSLTVTSADVRLATGQPNLALGKPYGLVATPLGAILRDELADPARLVTWHCDGRLDTAVLPADERRARLELRSVTDAQGVPAGALLPAGLVGLGDVAALADLVTNDESRVAMTEFLRLGDSAPVRVRGSYIVRDSRADVGVLLEEGGSVPRLILVGPSTFSGILSP